jgi:tetratricopeptide (TPR) repeat protein
MRDGSAEAPRGGAARGRGTGAGIREFFLRNRGWILGTAVLLLTLVLGRGWLSERLVPDPRLNRQLEQAQLALRQGRLSESGGQGARELFEAVLAADPDQTEARQGLVDVANAAIDDAERALERGQVARARSRLELAVALSAPSARIEPLQQRLRDFEAGNGSVAQLLAAAEAPGIGDEAALDLLQRALRIEPANDRALLAREVLLGRWLKRADAALSAGRIEEAQRLVTRVVAADPGHVELPAIRGRLGETLAQRQAARSASLSAAAAHERAGRLDAAARRYSQLLKDDPGDADARAGLVRLAARMAEEAQRQAADFRFSAADASLARARQWDPGAAAVERAAERVAQSRAARDRVRHPLTAADRKRIANALAQSREAIARGDLLSPPGASAWDRLRVASALAPSDPGVLAVQRQFATASLACFEPALSANQLRRAQECLEASLLVDAARKGAAADRARLAERWAARAEERLGASDLAAAEAAYEAARRWTPGDASLEALGQRLRRARATSP